MAIGLRLEDSLEGATNFSLWKAMIVLLLQENELWEVVENTTTDPITIPVATDATTLAAFNKKNIKEKRIMLDAVKYHVIPHIYAKKRAHEMWTTLTNLYQGSNENRKMVLREKLKSIKMTKSETMTCYLSRITQVRDELVAIGEVIF